MVELKNRRVEAMVGRTIKHGERYEFYKFELKDGGDLPQEFASDEEARVVRDELFKQLNEEALMREAAFKAIQDSSTIDKIVRLLRSIFSSTQQQPAPDPPPIYYTDMDVRDDED